MKEINNHIIMSLDYLQNSFVVIGEDLKNTQERREILIKSSRDVISLCSKSIVSIHSNKLQQAKEEIKQAKAKLDELRGFAQKDLYKYISIGEQELVEAYSLYALMQNSQLPSIEDLNVMGTSYLTGLLDCIGEIKRMIFDLLKLGNIIEATKFFNTMQEIYETIYPFAIYDNIVPGLRRKLDVAKILIEDIRSIITEESRRAVMIEAIEKLKERFP
jgi:translin